VNTVFVPGDLVTLGSPWAAAAGFGIVIARDTVGDGEPIALVLWTDAASGEVLTPCWPRYLRRIP
jgi:hypothetical protein